MDRRLVHIGWWLEGALALVLLVDVLAGQTWRATITVLALFVVDGSRRRNAARAAKHRSGGERQ